MGKLNEGQPVINNPPSSKEGDIKKGAPVVPNKPQPQKPAAPKDPKK